MYYVFLDSNITAAAANSRRQPGRDLLRRVVRLALDDVKEKYPGILLSAHATKVCQLLLFYSGTYYINYYFNLSHIS